jgi:hypothetical protein
MTSQLQTANPVRHHPRKHQALRLARKLTVPFMLISIVLVLAPGLTTPARSALTDTVSPLPPVTATGIHLGMAYANYQIPGSSEYFTPLAAAAGARWDRVDFAWDRIEANRNQFYFEPWDHVVTRDHAHGLGTVGILMGTPDWAANCSQAAATVARASGVGDAPFLPLRTAEVNSQRKCPPHNLYLPWDHPDNYWGRFVRQTVVHYRDRVHIWEMWNEPDLYDWFWTGSTADYAQLLKVGYQAVKAEDPDAIVLFAGLAYWANPDYYVTVLDHLKAMPGAADENYYFDVMSLHLYSSVYTIGPVAASMQTAMTQRVGPRHIWLTEAGVPLWDEVPGATDDYKLNRATAEEAAAYVIQAFSQARSAGIAKFFFFRTHDNAMTDGSWPAHFGLMRDDASYRPAYVAYQVAASYLHGENQVTRPPITAEGVQRITFWGTPRGRIDVLWNVTGAPLNYDYPTLLPEVTVVTKRGVVTTLSSTGSVALPLEAATANTGEGGSLLIGGAPLLVIQADTVPPTSQLQPLPSVWYGRAVTVTLNVADTAGPGKPGTGYWYSRIERAPTPMGPWTLGAGWPETQGVTTVAVPIPAAGTWYFRAQARDLAGNWEALPAGPETQTTVFVTRPVQLSVDTYIDANSSGSRDPGEGSAPGTTLTWATTGGVLVDQHAGPTWTVTKSVEADDYVITARAPGYLPALHRFTITAGPEPLQIHLDLGLKPVRSVLHLPLLLKQR